MGGFTLVLTLTACGTSKIHDASTPQAQQCKEVLQARLNNAFATIDAAPDPTAANAAIANALAGATPEECTGISDDLGAKLMNQLVAEAAGRYRANVNALGTLPPPGSTAPTGEPSPAPTEEPTATPTSSPTDTAD
jgi:NaMN:DMB phosphoribosyltransferase